MFEGMTNDDDMGIPGDADVIQNMSESANLDPAMKEQIKGMLDAGDIEGAMALLMQAYEGLQADGNMPGGIDGAMAEGMMGQEEPMV
jgi:hypothetical protein